MTQKTSIVIAEDHALFRAGLKSLIATWPEFEVAGEARDGLEVIQMTKELTPGLVLLDLSMPKLGGLESISEIKKQSPDTKVLVVSMHATEKHLRAALDAGANGYLLKLADEDEFRVAVKAVMAGKSYLSSEFTGRVLQAYQTMTPEEPSVLDILTSREREILKLVAEGYTNRKIGHLLYISIKTVEKHRTNLMKKLDLHNALELADFARRHGLISD